MLKINEHSGFIKTLLFNKDGVKGFRALSFLKNGAGFTLIELLVVISIIGFLATASVLAFNNARMKARDAIRQADLKQISTAIELHYDKYGSYPRTSGWCTQISHPSYKASFQADLSEWLPDIPLDPIYHDTYQDYFYRNIDDQSYYLYAELETSDRAEDGLSGCTRIGDSNNEYDWRFPNF